MQKRGSLGKASLVLIIVVLGAVLILAAGSGSAQEIQTGPVGAPQSARERNDPETATEPSVVLAPTDHGQLFDGLLYALREVPYGANEIYGFRADGATGAITPLPGFPVETGGNGSPGTLSERLYYDRAGQRLFAINNGSNTLSAFKVDLATGGLLPLPYHNTSLGSGGSYGWNCVTVHPGGSPLVIGTTVGNELRSYNVTDKTLTEASDSPYTAEANTYSCTFSRDGGYVYAGTNSVYAYSVNSATGQLRPLRNSPYALGNNPVAYSVDDASRFFLANFGTGEVRAAISDGGVLTGVTGNPFASGLTTAVHGQVHPGGFYMVADRGDNQVGVYAIGGSGAGTTLKAVSGSPFSTGAAGTSDSHILALHQGGHFLYVANGATRNITRFAVNQSTGALSNLGSTAADSVGASGRISGLAFAPIAGQYPRILLHSDDPEHLSPNSYVEQALGNLGLAYSATHGSAQGTFNTKLASGKWDLVIFMADSWPMSTDTASNLDAYVKGGGRLIAFAWNLSGIAGHALFNTLRVQYLSDVTGITQFVNVPIYQWDAAHPIFNSPEQVPSPIDWVNCCSTFWTGGQRLEPLAGAVALAGYTPSVTPNQAALIVANSGRTIYKAFGDAWHTNSDKDNDQGIDAVQLWMDMISYVSMNRVYIPTILNNACAANPTGRETEPNDNQGQANPICFDLPVKGDPNEKYPDAELDYFKIQWDGNGTLQVDLANLVANPQHAQLVLYPAGGSPIQDATPDGSNSFQIIYKGKGVSGTYYFLAAAGDRSASAPEYTLTVSVK